MATDLVNGTETRIDYNGTYQDFTIPSGISTPAELDVFLKGGDGGKRVVPGLCKYKGGRGVKVLARFPVGTAAGDLQPGGRIRFIVGQDGAKNRGNRPVGAGGGGGTAVLYTTASSPACDPPSKSLADASSKWVILAVAGGGGGAYASGVCDGENGRGGQASENGTKSAGPDSSGGTNGDGGKNGGSHDACTSAGPGGGAFTAGQINQPNCENVYKTRPGGAGLCTGGAGGTFVGGLAGGFGYGAGGSGSKFLSVTDQTGGGGGGGYSGGGGGETYGRGGGGGSFLSAGALAGSYKDNGGATSTPDPGFVTYTLGPPTSVVAICNDVTLDLGSGGTATLLVTDVDGGSVFPDVTGYTPTHELRINKGSVPQFLSSATSLDYGCSDLGDGYVTLYALLEDGSTVEDLDTCAAPITVQDTRDFTLSNLSNQTVIADGDTCSTTVTGLPVPSAQGLCPGVGVTLSYGVDLSPAGGTSSTLPYTDGELHSLALDVGSATVHYAAESDGGGTSPATSYDITVLSGQTPVARCHSISIQLDANGQASISPSDLDGRGGLPSADPCLAPVSLSLDKSAFTCANVGTNYVTLTATGDSGLTGTCTATVTVGADSVDPSAPGCAAVVNDPPTLSAPASIPVTEDVPKTLAGISFADVDAGSGKVLVTLSVDGGALSATTGAGVTVGGTATALTLTGTVAAINGFVAAGGVTFTPAPNATATVTLGVLIDDRGHTGAGGAKTASQNVTLALTAVDDPPTISAPASLAVTEDTASALGALVFTDPDTGSDPVRVTLSVPSGSLAAGSAAGVVVGGSVGGLTLEGSDTAINGLIAGGGLTFTTALHDTQTVALKITIDDQGHNGSGGPLTDTATVDLLVDAVNHPPTIDAPTSLSLTVGSPYPLTALSFDDLEAGDLDVKVTLTVDGGALDYSASSGASATAGPMASGTPTALTLVGSLAELNAAFSGGEVTYTADRPGTFALTITIDDEGDGIGPAKQTTATVLLDDAPQPVAEVPTLGSWGRLALLALLAAAALYSLRRL